MSSRRFELHRDVDISGVSGLGVVAEGILFTDGTVALRWLLSTASTGIYSGLADVTLIHGHSGNTRIVFVDNAPDRLLSD